MKLKDAILEIKNIKIPDMYDLQSTEINAVCKPYSFESSSDLIHLMKDVYNLGFIKGMKYSENKKRV